MTNKTNFMLIICIFIVTSLSANIIDFEDLTVGTVLSNQYLLSHGVTFSSSNHTLQIWEKGNSAGGYFSGSGTNEVYDQSSVGSYYLGTNQEMSNQNFTIHYVSPVSVVTGSILDLEGSEQAIFKAWNQNNEVLESFTWVGTDVGGNGSVVNWSFNRSSTDISYVTIDSYWVALDNISGGNPIPEPSVLTLLIFGLIGFTINRKMLPIMY